MCILVCDRLHKIHTIVTLLLTLYNQETVPVSPDLSLCRDCRLETRLSVSQMVYTKWIVNIFLTMHVLAEWDSDCAGERVSFCQQEWRDISLQTILVSYHKICYIIEHNAFSTVTLQTPTRATADQLQLLYQVSCVCDDRHTHWLAHNMLYIVCFSSMNEEDMRVMLVSTSPLTTSVNAITWQDYIGTCTYIQ